ncbi:gp93 [Mycobacterium phage Barnyard]|uniref:Uncharacterized protein n=1 Tax=Mycobacterium phage Barnyard TaxID=205880 RepID=Q855X9_9CAUD|nr:gp93 [Mycobacterium phage Barnyard]AAN02147.1 hypothetical protein PBI_BARNYARD_93 [Mycobacterium phage Barnyard]
MAQYIILAIIILGAVGTQWLEWSSNRYAVTKQKAFDFYVETGYKAEAFRLLSRRAVKAAEKRRLALIRMRERENGRFQALCACPACTRLETHFIALHNPYRNEITRECIFCSHVWTQKAL